MIARLPSALDHLGEIAARADGKQLAVFLDYDGTLTPIVDEPARALLPDATREAIGILAGSLPVAVVSGRDLADVRRLVGIDGLWYAGSHGFDIAGPDGERHELAPDALSALDDAERELRPLLRSIAGARLERKRYAVTAHFRGVPGDRIDDVEVAVAAVAAACPGLRVTGGKKVLELRPDIDWDKGRAIAWLLGIQGLDRPDVLPVYVGDDETDEDGFRALDGHGIGIVVRGEADDRPTRAHYALDGPADVPSFLRLLRGMGR
jgi:trehalose 6-phosphate phosphatase